jgi:predicted DNA-binding transcriptional regulator YafY
MESKIKLLKVLDIMSETDKEHPITASSICSRLKEEGISAERKSICRDINTLIKHGYKITLCHDNKLGYYMNSEKPKKASSVPSHTISVVLEYDKEKNSEVEKIFGKKLKTVDEEGFFSEFRVDSASLFSKLLEAGELVQLIEPKDLRERFISLAENAVAFYNKPKGDKKIEVWLL